MDSEKLIKFWTSSVSGYRCMDF